MKELLCLTTADVHGNITQYEKIKQTIIEKDVDHVFLCGDLLPKKGGLWNPGNKIRTIKMQRKFIEGYFNNYLNELSMHTNVYAIFGNDDFKSNYNLLPKDNKKITFLNNDIVPLANTSEELYVAGYPYVSLTPFLQKDWEKWDNNDMHQSNKIYRTDGYTSQNGRHYPIQFENNEDKRSSIKTDLDALAKLHDPQKTVYVFHDAPYNTPLDMTSQKNPYIKENDLHIGSKAIRNFIETYNPLLTMHGHIHETFEESGNYKWKNNSSIAVTAANDFTSPSVAYVLFSLPSLANMKRSVR